MQRVAGHVAVVTTRGPDGIRRGLTATAFCSLTAEPPSVIACVNRETWVGSMLPESDLFCVNVLGSRHRDVAEAFAGIGSAIGEERFRAGHWRVGSTGAPVLDGAIAAFDCSVDGILIRSTHLLVVGAVQEVTVGDPGDRPLIYVGRQFGSIA